MNAMEMCRKLPIAEGFLSGTSTGGDVLEAIRLGKELESDATIVTIRVTNESEIRKTPQG